MLRVEGKFQEARSFYKGELELRRKVVGEDSLQVAITLTNLAGTILLFNLKIFSLFILCSFILFLFMQV